eukprot:5860517-Amphidinium_carterae.2
MTRGMTVEAASLRLEPLQMPCSEDLSSQVRQEQGENREQRSDPWQGNDPWRINDAQGAPNSSQYTSSKNEGKSRSSRPDDDHPSPFGGTGNGNVPGPPGIPSEWRWDHREGPRRPSPSGDDPPPDDRGTGPSGPTPAWSPSFRGYPPSAP